MGVDWSLREGYAWAEDKEHCEEYGRMLQADPNKVSSRAKKRGLPQVMLPFKSADCSHSSICPYSHSFPQDCLASIVWLVCCDWQLGTLGAGNHYAEIQVVDDIYNEYAARKMGIDHKGQVCVMIHSGSRGLGHQVATGMIWLVQIPGVKQFPHFGGLVGISWGVIVEPILSSLDMACLEFCLLELTAM